MNDDVSTGRLLSRREAMALLGMSGAALTSQLYFDDTLTDHVHQREPYASRGTRTVRNEGDGIFRNGGDQLMLPLIEKDGGYAGQFHVGVHPSGLH